MLVVLTAATPAVGARQLQRMPDAESAWPSLVRSAVRTPALRSGPTLLIRWATANPQADVFGGRPFRSLLTQAGTSQQRERPAVAAKPGGRATAHSLAIRSTPEYQPAPGSWQEIASFPRALQTGPGLSERQTGRQWPRNWMRRAVQHLRAEPTRATSSRSGRGHVLSSRVVRVPPATRSRTLAGS